MSADLLRRAATRLRESALAATPGPWKVIYFGDRGYPQRVVDDRATLIAQTYEGRDTTDPVRFPAGAPEYIALVHPPVALALADWLDHAAFAEEHLPPRRRSAHALAVARAVLREPEGGPGCYALTNAGRGLECGIHGKTCSFARQGREPEGGETP